MAGTVVGESASGRRPSPTYFRRHMLELIRRDTAHEIAETEFGRIRFRPVAHDEILFETGNLGVSIAGQKVLADIFLIRQADGSWAVGYPNATHFLIRTEEGRLRPCSSTAEKKLTRAVQDIASAWAPGKEVEFRAAHLERLAIRCSVRENELRRLEAQVRAARADLAGLEAEIAALRAEAPSWKTADRLRLVESSLQSKRSHLRRAERSLKASRAQVEEARALLSAA